MRPFILKLVLAVILVAFSHQCFAQSCNGSLGDPVIKQDFGTGKNYAPPIAAIPTTLQFVPYCPGDENTYTLINSFPPQENCRRSSWFSLFHDHTGNKDGLMMMINASSEASVFYTQHANGLCPSTTYYFSSFILNLVMNDANDGLGAFVQPNILFSIETPGGQVLAQKTTGTIPATDTATWNEYGVYFTTPSNVTDIVVKMSNLEDGNNGNDLVLDDITFRACGPVIEAGIGSVNGPLTVEFCTGTNAAYTLNATVLNSPGAVYQWQLNKDSTTWTDIAGANENTLDVKFMPAIAGTYQYRLGIANGSAISSVACRVYSSPINFIVDSIPVVPPIPPQAVCEGAILELAATGAENYLWTGPNIPPTTHNPLYILSATDADAGTYTVQATSGGGCPAQPVQVKVTVLKAVTAASVSNDTTVCAGTPTQLLASGGTTYNWKPSTGLDHDDIPNPVAKPMQTTTYIAAVSNGACDTVNKAVTITVMQDPAANAGGAKKVFEGKSVMLNGSDGGDQVTGTFWTPAIQASMIHRRSRL
jgi:hypothetical protein